MMVIQWMTMDVVLFAVWRLALSLVGLSMMPAYCLKLQVGHDKPPEHSKTQHSFRMELFGLLIPLLTGLFVMYALTLSLGLAL